MDPAPTVRRNQSWTVIVEKATLRKTELASEDLSHPWPADPQAWYTNFNSSSCKNLQKSSPHVAFSVPTECIVFLKNSGKGSGETTVSSSCRDNRAQQGPWCTLQGHSRAVMDWCRMPAGCHQDAKLKLVKGCARMQQIICNGNDAPCLLSRADKWC